MKDEQQGLMEEEIFKEEQEIVSDIPPKTESKIPKKNLKQITIHFTEILKKIIFSAKKPKMISLIAIVLIIIVISLAFNLLSKRNEDSIFDQPRSDITLPSPQTNLDPVIAEISNKTEEFSKNINKIDIDFNKLAPPTIDYNLN
ncbi:hypothetical protein A3F02_03085 [Candidatus Curtissbacteria bacterium RIFCSPHIGHO2_12_FULL_38_9b]|uniref:Uncharacterized protein n=2 Tax=Candidatus Curtissiibacteriota TaxID=1752717 RepID=A0A1F5GZE9_9BACT|nr:MAG: hypothetical protein A3A48_00955 [Candidatus Curtissbacteria bacterium RIFCSPLOWO2_01_FULL_37_9]OGD97157.1 MAG: hypothetical protein A3F02_03085 [Candidatus Curtissbacteria bacterium RIFCSPHIGHO2_12_FULL_38_9b]